MQSILFLSVLFISITLIYLAVCKKTIQINIENFENTQITNSINNISIENIANQLKISPTRIKNYKENGTIDNVDNYSIDFEIQPRNILQLKLNEPSLNELQQKLLQMTETNETFNLKSSTGKDIFLSKILININSNESNKIILIDENQKKKEDLMKNKDKFVDPQLEKSIKYLKDTEKGFTDDYDLDPRYYFDKGELLLEEDPGITQTPELTPEPTPEATKETFYSKNLTEVREFFV